MGFQQPTGSGYSCCVVGPGSRYEQDPGGLGHQTEEYITRAQLPSLAANLRSPLWLCRSIVIPIGVWGCKEAASADIKTHILMVSLLVFPVTAEGQTPKPK